MRTAYKKVPGWTRTWLDGFYLGGGGDYAWIVFISVIGGGGGYSWKQILPYFQFYAIQSCEFHTPTGPLTLFIHGT